MNKIPLLFLLFSIATSVAAVAAAPKEVTPDEVDGYKFGIEQGCRETAIKAGRTWEQGDSVCSCTMETLSRNFTFRDWQRAVKPEGVANGVLEKQILLEHADKTKKCITSRDAQHAAGKIARVPSLIGRWEWVMPSGCVESYTFKPGGAVDITSGEEKTSNMVEISPTPEKSGRHKFAMKILKDNGGADCSKKTTDDTGKTNSGYLMMNFDATMMAMCTTADGTVCMGPLKRKRK